ncbi:hypothetical protein MLD38_016601 [Melastoma candidum]|uniref:Uncharacterized protein n=1 Tax=Melastoma candidum TaxID=119954 RepID=A0ACB9QM71_9MYRT|nr:hypothetical protein MLD38_016601 [Melastoma candidum]
MMRASIPCSAFYWKTIKPVAAAEIEQRLLLWSKLSDVVNTEDDAVALFNLFIDEGYILTELLGRFCVILKGNSSPQDMLNHCFMSTTCAG